MRTILVSRKWIPFPPAAPTTSVLVTIIDFLSPSGGRKRLIVHPSTTTFDGQVGTVFSTSAMTRGLFTLGSGTANGLVAKMGSLGLTDSDWFTTSLISRIKAIYPDTRSFAARVR